jgi:hypothetical protein
MPGMEDLLSKMKTGKAAGSHQSPEDQKKEEKDLKAEFIKRLKYQVKLMNYDADKAFDLVKGQAKRQFILDTKVAEEKKQSTIRGGASTHAAATEQNNVLLEQQLEWCKTMTITAIDVAKLPAIPEKRKSPATSIKSGAQLKKPKTRSDLKQVVDTSDDEEAEESTGSTTSVSSTLRRMKTPSASDPLTADEFIADTEEEKKRNQ